MNKINIAYGVKVYHRTLGEGEITSIAIDRNAIDVRFESGTYACKLEQLTSRENKKKISASIPTKVLYKPQKETALSQINNILNQR